MGCGMSNPFMLMNYDEKWGEDPDCCNFRAAVRQLEKKHFKDHQELAKQRILLREQFFEYPLAYTYAGWFLTNVTYDLVYGVT